MPRISETRNTAQPQIGQQQGGRKVSAQVAARAADNLPSYIPQMKNPDAEAFINGLATFQPKLLEWSDKAKQEQADAAVMDRMAGREAQDTAKSYTANYFATDGLVRSQEDGAALLAKYNTEFDKDKGDLEGWLQENYQGRLKGVNDEHYLQAYQRGIESPRLF